MGVELCFHHLHHGLVAILLTLGAHSDVRVHEEQTRLAGAFFSQVGRIDVQVLLQLRRIDQDVERRVVRGCNGCGGGCCHAQLMCQ
ncbi:hypothetical protein D3C71_2039500 [compost metagenome]